MQICVQGLMMPALANNVHKPFSNQLQIFAVQRLRFFYVPRVLSSRNLNWTEKCATQLSQAESNEQKSKTHWRKNFFVIFFSYPFWWIIKHSLQIGFLTLTTSRRTARGTESEAISMFSDTYIRQSHPRKLAHVRECSTASTGTSKNHSNTNARLSRTVPHFPTHHQSRRQANPREYMYTFKVFPDRK